MVTGLGKSLLTLVTLLLTASLAFAIPCRTDEEGMADIVLGFFVSQGIAGSQTGGVQDQR